MRAGTQARNQSRGIQTVLGGIAVRPLPADCTGDRIEWPFRALLYQTLRTLGFAKCLEES
jgi:hypothetical protein